MYRDATYSLLCKGASGAVGHFVQLKEITEDARKAIVERWAAGRADASPLKVEGGIAAYISVNYSRARELTRLFAVLPDASH